MVWLRDPRESKGGAASANGCSDSDSGNRNRFQTGAPSQTFYHLLASLEDQKAELHNLPDGRRTFLFVARTGVGKGHFFANLASGSRLKQLRTAIGDTDESSPWPAAFFNTSLSHEVSSVFDQITEFLICAAEKTLPDDPDLAKLRDQAKSKRLGRIGRLRLVLKRLGDWRLTTKLRGCLETDPS